MCEPLNFMKDPLRYARETQSPAAKYRLQGVDTIVTSVAAAQISAHNQHATTAG